MSHTSIPNNVTAILDDVHILICRPEDAAQTLSQTFSALGASCYTFPTLAIEALALSDTEKHRILSLDQYAHIIVTSQHAAKFGLEWIDSYWPQFPIEQTWFAIGKKTASILSTESLSLVSPEKDLSSEDLLASPPLQKVNHKKILILKGEEGRGLISQVLTKRGAKIDEVNVYKRTAPEYTREQVHAALIDFPAHYIAALSGETLLNLINLCQVHHVDLSSKTFIVPSHRVANIAYKHGFKSVLIPDNLNPIDLIKCITQHKRSGH